MYVQQKNLWDGFCEHPKVFLSTVWQRVLANVDYTDSPRVYHLIRAAGWM